MNVRDISRKVFEWIFRPAALRAAKGALPAAGGGQTAATRQAKLLLEVARRVAEPGEALPSGAQPALLLGLYRDAIWWALAARWPDGTPPPDDLRALWEASHPRAQTPTKIWAATPPDGAAAEALRKTVFDGPAPRSLAATGDDVARARAAAEALVWDLDAPRRHVEGVLIQRWLRLALIAAALVLLAIGVRVVLLGPDLAAGKPFRLSSQFAGWAGCLAQNGCHGLMFHTETEANPWIEIDLGAPTKVRRVEVINRGNCCAERAVPLVVEVSTDRVKFTPVARRDTPFGSWKTDFPAKVARYVRLRAERRTVLHLQSVVVR
jgi:hypothetical protein